MAILLLSVPGRAELYHCEPELRLLFADHGIAQPKDEATRRQAVLAVERVAAECFGIYGDCGCGQPEAIERDTRCQAAASALGRMGATVHAAAFDQLDDARTSWQARVWLVEQLGKSGDPRLMAPLVRALERFVQRIPPEPDRMHSDFAALLDRALERITGAGRETRPEGEWPADPAATTRYWSEWARQHGDKPPAVWWKAATARARAAAAGSDSKLLLSALEHLLAVPGARPAGRALLQETLRRRDLDAETRAALIRAGRQ
jgi:hypothetical protein